MERAAGMPFDDIMRQRVFEPLSIRASYDPRRISPVSDLSNGYGVRFFLPRLKYDAAKASPPALLSPSSRNGITSAPQDGSSPTATVWQSCSVCSPPTAK